MRAEQPDEPTYLGISNTHAEFMGTKVKLCIGAGDAFNSDVMSLANSPLENGGARENSEPRK